MQPPSHLGIGLSTKQKVVDERSVATTAEIAKDTLVHSQYVTQGRHKRIGTQTLTNRQWPAGWVVWKLFAAELFDLEYLARTWLNWS